MLQDRLSLDGDLSNSNDSLSADKTKVNISMFLARCPSEGNEKFQDMECPNTEPEHLPYCRK